MNRTPAEYVNWIDGAAHEAAEFEIAGLIHLSHNRKALADTNLPADILRKIAGFRQAAPLLSPQSMSVDLFFEKMDSDKQSLLARIRESENPRQDFANLP